MSKIIINSTIKAPVQFVFDSYLDPADNLRWNTAGDGWTTSYATINPVVGGEYHIGYKSPDEKNDFDLGGKYTEIVKNKLIKSALEGGRKVEVSFAKNGENTNVTITFDAEDENSIELQKQGWTKILTNFKNFVERKANPNNASITKNIEIKASKEKVWQTLLEDKYYRKWSSAFMEGSYYQGELKYQGAIQFLSPDEVGISSKIVVFIPNYQVSFEHLGVINNGEEDFESSHSEGWKGARETYTLTEKKGEEEITTLEIYVETTKNEDKMMDKMWDSGLAILKELAENS